MSCYAFLKRWLLPSLLYNCLYLFTFLSLNLELKTLSTNLGCFPLDNRPSHLLSDSTNILKYIRSFFELSKTNCPPRSKSALPYFKIILQAILKYISQRTSYTWVWLAFHSQPQIIRTFFYMYRFGPPTHVTTKFSTCSWLDHSASGLLFMTFISFLQTFNAIKIHYGPSQNSSYLRLLIKIKLAINKKLLAHYAKGTLLLLYNKASTDCMHWILGSFYSKKVLFHLSLTVLVYYRLLKIL